MTVKNDLRASPNRRSNALTVTASLVALGLGLAVASAQDAPKDGAWTAPSRAARKENPIPSDAKSIAQGKALFTMACVMCHGPQGKGDGPSASGLERNGAKIKPANLSDAKMWAETDGGLFWKMSEGNSPMPAFGQTFTEEQRWQLVNFVRTLAPRNVASTTTTATTTAAGN